MQLPIHQLTSTLSELSHLLTQSIFIPGRYGNSAATAPTQETKVENSGPSHDSGQLAKGNIVLFAGGKVSDRLIVDLIHQSGGRSSKICIVPSVMFDFARAGERYQRMFHRFGAQSTEIIDINSGDDRILHMLENSSLILFAGDGLRFENLDHEVLENTFQSLRKCWIKGANLAAFGGASRWLTQAVVPNLYLETESNSTVTQFFERFCREPHLLNFQRAIYLEHGSLLIIRESVGGYELNIPEGAALDISRNDTSHECFTTRPLFGEKEKFLLNIKEKSA